MTSTGQRVGRVAGNQAHATGPTGWAAWVLFAGVMMIMIGTFHGISGLVALFQDDYYVVGASGLVLGLSYTTWGWTHLLFGALLVAAGCGAMAGQTWARAVGVVLAILSAVANMVFLPAYPLWSVIMITLDVVVVYALVVHGREVADL